VGALTRLAWGLLLAASTTAGETRASARTADLSLVRNVDRWSPQIGEASLRFGIPAEWIRQVMRAESGGRTTLGGRQVTSRAGAMGLMQLMPRTWAEMRALLRLGTDPYDPRDNILAGAAYLRAMYDRFGYPGLFAAYNAGPRRYAEYLSIGRRLPAETVAYVAAVGRATSRAAPSENDLARSGIFAAPASSRSRIAGAVPPAATVNSLFVPLSTAPAGSE
jgi:soluble lytic murein transglycosylase-like protein